MIIRFYGKGRQTMTCPASYRSMAASSLLDLMYQAKGIAFYGSAASFNQHFMCYLEPHNNCVAWMLLSGHQKLGHKQPSFWPLFSWQDYKHTGMPLPGFFQI